MQTRSSRYLDENISTKPKLSRSNKNKYLYDEVNKNIGYEEIESFSNYEELKLDSSNSIKTREEYQQSKSYKDFGVNNTGEKVQVFEEEKKYDINSVLEYAKRNRVISDEVEKKRNLQNVEYNILADLNKKYMSKKEKIEEELEKERIRELIDTITSKSLVKDLEEALDEENDGDLMSDLMATNTLTAVKGVSLGEEIAKEILANEKDDDDSDEISNDHGTLVNSFYTKSMDLTEHDFEFKEEIEEESKEKRKILILVVLIVIVVIAIVSVFILKKIGVI